LEANYPTPFTEHTGETEDKRSNKMMNINRKKLGLPLCYPYLHVALLVFMKLYISRAVLDTKDTYIYRSQKDCLKLQVRDEGEWNMVEKKGN